MTMIASYSSDVQVSVCLVYPAFLKYYLSNVSSTRQCGPLEDCPGMPVTCLLGVEDPRSLWMTEPYSSLTSVSLSGVGGLLKLLQMQFSSNQLDSCPPVVHGHIRDSRLSIMDVLCHFCAME